MPSEVADPQTEITRLRRKLRDTRADLRDTRAELARRPPAPSDDDLTEAEVRHLHAQFVPSLPGTVCQDCGKAHPGPCQTCGGLHARACPRVRSVSYVTQGDKVLISQVTFWPDGKWSTDGIIWPDELPPLPGEA